jgi:uncharacterized DUF497 family protein
VDDFVLGDSHHFEWDDAKAQANVEKHGVRFQEAAEVFLDPLASYGDDAGAHAEDRYYVIGINFRLRMLIVVHTERTNRIRIISARLPTANERRVYEQQRS